MARFAPVVPIQIARELQKGPKDYLGRYHLLLAHDILEKPDEYREVYNKVREDYEDSFIILDNSIVELGHPLDLDDLLAAANIVPPDCIVIPDAMGDGAGTREMAKTFVREYCRYFQSKQQFADEVPALLGVLQGSNVDDAMETTAVMYSLPMVDYVSVPRIFANENGSRMPVLHELIRRDTYKLFKGVHLLGFSNNILDDVACARMQIVKGIDSAVPIRAGLATMEVRDAMWAYNWSSELGPRGKFWDIPIEEVLQPERLACIRENLDQYRRWIQE
jgi:hypothetical protein